MANDINQVVMIGNLTRDMEIRYAQNGNCIGNFSLAVNRAKKQGDKWIEETSFFDVSLFGKMAESLKPYLVRGQKVCVVGYLKQDRWEKDGKNYSKVVIVAENIQLCGGGKKDEGKGTFRPDKVYNSAQEALDADAPCTSDFNEDLPF